MERAKRTGKPKSKSHIKKIPSIGDNKKDKRERSRSQSYENYKKKENIDSKKDFNYLSKESDNKRTNINIKPIKDYMISLSPKDSKEKALEETLFNRKELSLKLFINNITKDLEEVNIDNTLHQYQSYHLENIIQKLNTKEKIFNDMKEEIQKAGVVLTEKEFFEKINKLSEKELLAQIKYKNYKINFINCLDYLLKFKVKKDDVDIFSSNAKNFLGLDKEYKFNNYVDISDENIYYYNLCLKLNDNIYKILKKFKLYTQLLTLLKNFLENKNLNDLNSDDILYFEIINYYLTDKEAICNANQRNYILENLSKNIISKEDLIIKINEINDYSKKNDYLITLYIDEDNNYLEFNYTQEESISNKQDVEKTYSSKFTLDSLMNSFKKITADELNSHLDDKIYKYIIYSKIKDNNIISDLIPSLKKAVLNITNSNAMKKFFKKTYQKNYDNIIYDFDKKEVIDNFFERIRIIPIYENVDAFADPINLKIYLPSNPGEIKKLCYTGEIKVLRFGRYLLLIIHELLGHLMRRYYYYLTNGKIPQNTPDDKKMNFKKEGGLFIEKELLGRDLSNLSIKDIFFLLRPKDDYPLIDRNSYDLSLDDIKNVILTDEYKDLFDFISLEKTKDENDKISLQDYYYYLTMPPYSITKSNVYSHTSFISI